MREHNCHNCYRALYDEECPSPFVKSEECPDWEAYPESYIKRKEQEKKDIAKAQENCRTCIHKKVCRFNYPDVSLHIPIRVECEYKQEENPDDKKG